MRFRSHWRRTDVGLRWWEVRLLEFLVRSPRINRIVVEVFPPDDEYDESLDDERHEANLRQQLEWLYQGPSAGDYREG